MTDKDWRYLKKKWSGSLRWHSTALDVWLKVKDLLKK